MAGWNKQSIRRVITDMFGGRKIIAVSNREPYSPSEGAGPNGCRRPASGLVSAIDPMMRASGGVWIAQGTAPAQPSRIAGPEDPAYTVRRVWLSSELKRGFYDDLSNDAMWPACHLTFRRPSFSDRSWASYRRVNEIFAEAVLDEAAGEPAVVIIHDYHFALLPKMLKERSPDLAIAHFWHIPWPAPEVVRVLPWREELFDGLLGNDLLGFQLPEHCSGFLSSVTQSGPVHVDQIRGQVNNDGHVTSVRPFPISIDFEAHVKYAASKEIEPLIHEWTGKLGGRPEILGIGIDRIDYTKGIPERLAALDLLFEEHPEYSGRLVFVQVGVPSRTTIARYHDLNEEIAALVTQINQRWARRGWQPIVYLPCQVDQQRLIALHLLADLCLVTPLHDGMNLVAKEFAASRVDEDGVLILSEFAGAAKELTRALIVNPFSVHDISNAIHRAIVMTPEERRERMVAMRKAVAANNIYRWASDFLSTLAETPAVSSGVWGTLPEYEDHLYAKRTSMSA